MNLDEFSTAVESGLKLSKRIYVGKDRSLSPPRATFVEKSSEAAPSYEPTAPMVYAVISDPAIVDNPDLPSYQPHVHGQCDPPALIPLHMSELKMDVDCYLDRVFVSVKGSWRVHCVMGSRSCDCRVVVPMGEQGSVLGAEIKVSGTSYSTQIMPMEQTQDMAKTSKSVKGSILKPHIFSVTVPQVDGGSILSVEISWFQHLMYEHGQFSITIPFTFPQYVNPFSKKIPLSERINLGLNTGFDKEVILRTTSHPMKETRRQMGKLGFQYDTRVLSWSKTDFHFCFEVSSGEMFGGVLLQSPSVHDYDQRALFSIYLFPGKDTSRKALREVVFLVDISGSMGGTPLDSAKKAVTAALAKFTPEDMFNIIAFNGETFPYSSYLKEATTENVESSIQWMDDQFVAGGGTNFLDPLKEAMKMLSDNSGSIPHIFLITDGSVDDERNICQLVETQVANGRNLSPRISSFGLGSYCNHYFLRMLAMISRGHYDAVFDADMIEVKLQRFFTRTLSAAVVNISINIFDNNDDFEGEVDDDGVIDDDNDDDDVPVYPSLIPDLSSEAPLVLSGRYQGRFPDSIQAKGLLADMSMTTIDVKVQKAKDIPLDKAFAKQQIELLTARAWFSENKGFVEKIAKISTQTAFISEFTQMVLIMAETENLKSKFGGKEVKKLGGKKKTDVVDSRIALLHGLNLGFGNTVATMENTPTGLGESTNIAVVDNVLSKTFREVGGLCDCCCFCCIGCCSKMNNQCVIVLTQFCTALSIFGCLDCCITLCCPQAD